MVRSSIRARLIGLAAMTALVLGTFVPAGQVAAASPGVAPTPAASTYRSPAESHGARSTSAMKVNVRQLMAQPHRAMPFDSAAADAAIAAIHRPASVARTLKPGVVGPPDPDLATSSGAPAATTPIAVAGQARADAGAVDPANPGIAVGPDQTVQTDGVGLQVSDRSGNVLGSVLLPTFFGLPKSPFTTWDSDPRIRFDTLRQRWILSEVSWDCATATFVGDDAVFGHSYVDYAVSDTADAMGNWVSTFDFAPDLFSETPSFGASTDKLGISLGAIEMGPGGGPGNPNCLTGAFVGGFVIVHDWSQLAPNFNPNKVVGSAKGFTNLDNLRIADQEPITNPELRVISSGVGPTADDVLYYDVTGLATKNSVVVSPYFDLTADNILAAFADPPSPRQSGGGGTLTSAIDGLPDSVLYHAGTLAFTTTYPCTPASDTSVRDCQRVVTLANPGATLEPTRLGDVLLATNGVDNSFGGIAWSGSGDLVAVYTASSSSSHASSYARYHLPAAVDTDPTSWSAAQLLSAGAAAYTGASWGSYLTAGQDPQDPNSVWASDPFVAGDGTWATQIHQIVIGAGAGYTPLAPVRVLDTRFGIGLSGAFVSNTSRTFAVANTNGIPKEATAITGNLTVTGQTAAGYVSLSPTATNSPTSSTINFPLGDTRANNVTIALAADGSLSAIFKASGGKHVSVILDVTGYFEAGTGQGYFPLPATRILDTRSDPTIHSFVANTPQSFMVQGVMGIDATATAITANLTVTGQTRAGYVSLTPAPDAAPLTSTINFPLGDVRANGLTIPINSDGTVSAVYKAKAGAKVNIVIDVTGYYKAGGGGLLFHPLNPGRRVDTRQPVGLGGYLNGLSGIQGTTPRMVEVAGHFGVPAGAAAITGNLTVTGQTAAGYVSITDASVVPPPSSTINFPRSDTRANGVTSTLGSGDAWFVYQNSTGKGTQLILDITGYFQ